MSDALPPGVSIYDRLVWPEGLMEQQLASGERRRELVAYLGADEYAALVPLAQAAAAVPPDPERRVVLVPGIMGSQLGVARDAPLPADLLWLDPVDFQQGGLGRLALGREDVRSFGPVVYSYLRLKLALGARGWTVSCFDYDWRHGVLELGRRLAAHLQGMDTARVNLVCHSMGGLVARAALGVAPERIGRVVTLGTPHGGAYAPLQALRGVYGTVRRLAQLDPGRSAEQLAEDVFSGFPSLYDMLPRSNGQDWLDAACWPASGPRPRPAELARAARVVLPQAPARVHCIAGCGQPTVRGARLDGDGLRYTLDSRGDGTVTLDSALLPDHGHHYAPVPHSELPRDDTVALAVAELIETGATGQLPSREPRIEPALPPFEVGEAELRALFTAKLDWQTMTAEERRDWLDSLNVPLLPLC